MGSSIPLPEQAEGCGCCPSPLPGQAVPQTGLFFFFLPGLLCRKKPFLFYFDIVKCASPLVLLEFQCPTTQVPIPASRCCARRGSPLPGFSLGKLQFAASPWRGLLPSCTAPPLRVLFSHLDLRQQMPRPVPDVPERLWLPRAQRAGVLPAILRPRVQKPAEGGLLGAWCRHFPAGPGDAGVPWLSNSCPKC